MKIGFVRKIFLEAFCFLILGSMVLRGKGVEQNPRLDKQYRTEYRTYQVIKDAPDPATKEEAAIAFLKTYPKSILYEHVSHEYIKVMESYRRNGQTQKTAMAGEKLLALQPDNPSALNMTYYSHYQLQQYDKATQYGERLYASNPDLPYLSFILADSYLRLNNDEKVFRYGEKACATAQPKDCALILPELTRLSMAKEQLGKATEYAAKSIAGLTAIENSPQFSGQTWKNYFDEKKVQAYAIMGQDAAKRRRWTSAISNYEKVLGYAKKNSLKAEAWYNIGLSRWRQRRIDPAMEAFAKGSVQTSAPAAKKCRRNLEKLYRSTHNDSLAGVEEFVQRVTRR